MAYWQRKNGKYVYVFFHDKSTRKNVALKRRETFHLDKQTDSYIDAWVQEWSLKHEGKKIQLENISMSGSKCVKLATDFVQFLFDENKLSKKTILEHKSLLFNKILPYFHAAGKPKPDEWPHVSAQMRNWMRNEGLSENLINSCNITLRKFWAWLNFESHVRSGYELKLRQPNVQGYGETTPLENLIKTQDVMIFSRLPHVPSELRLCAVMGYFFSLRPQEIFGLTRSVFKAGRSNIDFVETVKLLRAAGMSPRLIVNIKFHRNDFGHIEKCPRQKPGGVIPCWSNEVEEFVVEYLKEFEPEQPLFTMSNNRLYKQWAKYAQGIGTEEPAKLNCTLKDLRRSSLHFLGHHTELSQFPFSLQKYARHKDLKTTMLYLRTPEQQLDKLDNELNLEA